MKEKFNSIDLFKFFMAIAVVAIHTNPFAHCESTLVNQVVIVIEDISVPFSSWHQDICWQSGGVIHVSRGKNAFKKVFFLQSACIQYGHC